MMSGEGNQDEEVVEGDLIMVVEDEEVVVDNDSDGSPSPPKTRKLTDEDDEDGYLCLICYCPFTNSGEHRLSCLACGHIFGKSCIVRWLKTSGTCPQCNDRARKKDVRILYTKQLQALDTAERDRALQELESAKVAKQHAELEIAKLKILNQANHEEIIKLQDEVKSYKAHVASLELIIQASVSSSSSAQMKVAFDKLKTNPSSMFFGGETSKMEGSFFSPHGHTDWKGEECRVGAYSEWSNAFVVSHKFNNRVNSGLLKAFGDYGVRIFNWADPKKQRNMPIHQKEIRDVAFSPSQTDLLLTVGMDCKACLTNIDSTVQVLTFTTENPIWSCAFNTVDPHIIYMGLGNGQIVAYDIRKPKEVLENLNFPHDKTPVSRLQFVPQSYQRSGFSASGILAQKLTTCWFVERQSQMEHAFHQLPFDGGFLGIDFEPISRHILVSCRASPKNPTRHMVCEMTSTNYEGSGATYGCNVVKTYLGGSLLGKMYRPKIFSPTEGKVFVAATKSSNEVDMWDVTESDMKQILPVNNVVLDYIPVKHNDNYFLNCLTSDGLVTYKY